MCGIAFDVRRPGSQVDEMALHRAVARMAHRGPDGQRVWVDDSRGIGLGHARLAIVDLTPAGDQPLTNEDGSLQLVANGEVYNHRELRAELERRGHVFASQSDCEVFVHGFEEWGVDVLRRVRGMFALALAEEASRRVLLARDRMGEKPLAYIEDDHGVAGASEIPALRQTGRVSDALDPRALAYFLARNLRHIPDPLSIFADVQKLRPGHLLIVDKGEIVAHDRWWQPTWRRARKGAEQRLVACLSEAVALQREADVEVAALLSGGVDSSIVVGLASQARRHPLRTYALGRTNDDPELDRARAAAARFETIHHEFHFDARQLDRLDALVSQLGEPIALLPLTHADVLLRQVHAAGLKVVLTGNGADELLYGYSGAARLRRISALMRVVDVIPTRVRDGLARRSRLPSGLRLVLTPTSRRKTEIYRADIRRAAGLLREDLRPSALMPEHCPVFGTWAEAYDGASYCELSQFLTLVVEDAHSVTISADLSGMHSSVEARSPFLDGEVVEAALAMAPWRKSGPLWRPLNKRVLKRRFASLIGDDVVQAPKMGFGYALQEGQLLRGTLRERVEERLRHGEGLQTWFDHEEILRCLDEHMAGRRDHGKMLLSLYAFETWYREVFLAPARDPAPAS